MIQLHYSRTTLDLDNVSILKMIWWQDEKVIGSNPSIPT